MVYKILYPHGLYRVSPVPIQTFLTFRYPYTERGLFQISSFVKQSTVFVPNRQTRPLYFVTLRCSSIHFMLRTACLLTRTLLTIHQVVTYFIQCNVLHTASTCIITDAVGYMLHGSLVLPRQDFHLQVCISLAGRADLL